MPHPAEELFERIQKVDMTDVDQLFELTVFCDQFYKKFTQDTIILAVNMHRHAQGKGPAESIGADEMMLFRKYLITSYISELEEAGKSDIVKNLKEKIPLLANTVYSNEGLKHKYIASKFNLELRTNLLWSIDITGSIFEQIAFEENPDPNAEHHERSDLAVYAENFFANKVYEESDFKIMRDSTVIKDCYSDLSACLQKDIDNINSEIAKMNSSSRGLFTTTNYTGSQQWLAKNMESCITDLQELKAQCAKSIKTDYVTELSNDSNYQMTLSVGFCDVAKNAVNTMAKLQTTLQNRENQEKSKTAIGAFTKGALRSIFSKLHEYFPNKVPFEPKFLQSKSDNKFKELTQELTKDKEYLENKASTIRNKR
jgi:hypothetical protein